MFRPPGSRRCVETEVDWLKPTGYILSLGERWIDGAICRLAVANIFCRDLPKPGYELKGLDPVLFPKNSALGNSNVRGTFQSN